METEGSLGERFWLVLAIFLVILLFVSHPAYCEGPIDFPDDNLEKYIRYAIDKPQGSIYPSDLRGLTSFSANAASISNLSGLEYCINLKTLSLYYNNIYDIENLTELDKLQSLDLTDNNISNLQPLSKLVHLHRLYLSYNNSSDLKALSELGKLECLALNDNNISDVTPLSKLTHLEDLYLIHNNISDVTPLSKLTHLQTLFLKDNNISNLQPLSNLTEIKRLALRCNNISDVTPLSKLTHLEDLSLGYNTISNLQSLGNLVNLKGLRLAANNITDLNPLMALHDLRQLEIQRNLLDLRKGSTDMQNIQVFIDRGVIVTYSPQKELTNEPELLDTRETYADIAKAALGFPTPKTEARASSEEDGWMYAYNYVSSCAGSAGASSSISAIHDSFRAKVNGRHKITFKYDLDGVIVLDRFSPVIGATVVHSIVEIVGAVYNEEGEKVGSIHHLIYNRAIPESTELEALKNAVGLVITKYASAYPLLKILSTGKTAYDIISQAASVVFQSNERVLDEPSGKIVVITDELSKGEVYKLDFRLQSTVASGSFIGASGASNELNVKLEDVIVEPLEVEPPKIDFQQVPARYPTGKTVSISWKGESEATEDIDYKSYLETPYRAEVDTTKGVGSLPPNLGEWTEWTSEEDITYQISSEGAYIFYVKVRDEWGNVSEPIRTAFNMYDFVVIPSTDKRRYHPGETVLLKLEVKNKRDQGGKVGIVPCFKDSANNTWCIPLVGDPQYTLTIAVDGTESIEIPWKIPTNAELGQCKVDVFTVDPEGKREYTNNLFDAPLFYIEKVTITDFTPPSGKYVAGTETTTEVRVSNASKKRIQFWVGLSFRDEEDKVYDVAPKRVSLEPDGSAVIQFKWKIPSNAIIGEYKAATAAWEGYDKDRDTMTGDLYDKRGWSRAFEVISFSAETPVSFPDKNLEKAIRYAINKPTGDIYQSDLLGWAGVRELHAEKRGISDLTGLEYCTDLTKLWLFTNLISEFSPLAGLTNLTCLLLNNNQISDLSLLARLTNLTRLGLRYNQISDISPLAKLINLTELDLGNNQISDISPLAKLTNLTRSQRTINSTQYVRLWLGRNQISDISPLAKLTNVTWLDLGNNQISDLSPLAKLTNLTHLYLGDTQISDLSPLAGLTSLMNLYLWDNQISDISPLAKLTNLLWLDLRDNQISDISPLAKLTNLLCLDLGDNQITSLQALVDNPGLGTDDLVRSDTISLQYNYLDLSPGSDDMEDIQKLAGRGVRVTYTPQKEPYEKNTVLFTDSLDDAPLSFLDIKGVTITQIDGSHLRFEMELAGTVPLQPADYLMYLWSLDSDRDPSTGSCHDGIGAEFNLRVAYDPDPSHGGCYGWHGWIDVMSGYDSRPEVKDIEYSGNVVAMTIDVVNIHNSTSFNLTAHTGYKAQGDKAPDSGFASFP